MLMRNLLPLFLDLSGRDVLLVGGGHVAAGKLQQLMAAGAMVRVVSPLVVADIASIRQASKSYAVRSDRPTSMASGWSSRQPPPT